MCGIVGYIGDKKACPILINGLKTLEYRGYDSAGLAVLDNNIIKVYKEKGRVKNIETNNDLSKINASVGIAHTRWATHGKPSKENAHPHLDNSGNFAVVHNGIIENYLDLKEFLTSKGYHFDSDTDTEVIPNLLHYYYEENKDILTAFNKVLMELKGSYAILVVSPLFEGILVGKMASPLVIGVGKGENFLASDIPAVLDYTKKFYFLDDGEMAFITKKEIKFYNGNLKEVHNELKEITWDKNAADKNGYEDYMLKEIFEQPMAIKETVQGKIKSGELSNFLNLNIDKEAIRNINKIYIIACGTAMHAGLVGKRAIEKLCGITTIVDVASEFRYNEPLIDDKTLAIFVSQSGETADTIAALKLAKAKGAKCIATTNVVGSSITRETDDVLYTHAGPEIAVASTKAYVSQVAILISLAIYFAELLEKDNKTEIEEYKKELLELPEKIGTILENKEEFHNIAKKMAKLFDTFYIGRGNDYNIALEGSLKLKEISYIHSEAYQAGELKHGPIALVEDGTYIIGIITNPNIAEKTLSNLEEVITRGANVILITNLDIANDKMQIIKIPEVKDITAPILAIVPLQLIAYYIAKEKGLDVDKPRNLAKSVTVE